MMDEAVRVQGVFLHSMNLNSEFMVKCLQVLVNIFPEIRITSIANDELHFGFRVLFSYPHVDLVLAKKYLIVAGERIRIGPLRTLLTIHGVRKNGGEQLKAELHETICSKFGKLLPVSNRYLLPVSDSVTWLKENLRACVDAPELEELEIFNHEGYPNMFICLPSNNEILTVTFYCRQCANDGHTLQNCPSLTLDDEACRMTDYSELPNSSYNRHSDTSNSQNRETGDNEDFSSAASNFQDVFSSPSHSAVAFLNARASLRHLATPLKPPTRSVFFGQTSTAESTNTATTPKSEVGVTNTAPTPTTAVGVTNAAPTPKTAVGVTNAAKTPTTAVGITNAAQTSTTVGFMNPAPTLTTAVEDTKILSLRLQEIINMACEEINVISSNQLNAFFFYVKNKSNPLQIARKYTSNIEELINLLQKIISDFYNAPSATTNDKRFINWLEGLVKRFEESILMIPLQNSF